MTRSILVTVTIMLCVARVTTAQTQPPQQTQPAESTLDDTMEAGNEELATPKRDVVKWNHYDGELFYARLGGGYLYEGAAYAQDEISRQQFDLSPDTKMRDARFVFKGGFKTKRPITWSLGLMWDVTKRKFLYRETGVMFEVPPLRGHIFVGRTKEGFSLNKVMVGYAGWGLERTEINDATVPILADGVKWLGYAPEKHVLWNVGAYVDWLSEGQTFSTYEHQFAGRFAWVPIENQQTVLHLGVGVRRGKVEDGQLQLRSRPEAFPAPYFVDTGKFAADTTNMVGFEAYYRPRSFLAGGEYFLQDVNTPSAPDPFFHGGNVFVSWLATGEIRAYNTRGGFFNQVSPIKPVFQGGPGAWEIVANVSYIDLDSRTLRGGTFWRLTPTVNWHLSDNARLEFAYGYGLLDRFGLSGGMTHFFQSRVQLQL